MLMIICTWESENGNFKFKIDAHQLDLRLHHFSQFPLNVKKIRKLSGLWLAGEVVNHVGIYGSKAAEGLLVFQRWSCDLLKQVKFGVSGNFLQNAWEEWLAIWHVDVSWLPINCLHFGHGLLIFLILAGIWLLTFFTLNLPQDLTDI